MEANLKRRDFLGNAIQSAALLGLPLLNSRAVAAAEAALSTRHVTLASSLALTGILAGSAADISAGLQAAFRSANRSGGVNGREIKLLTMDDGYVASRTADNAKEVIASGSAVAMLSGQGTPNHAAMLPITEAAGMPVVGPITGADSLRQEKYRYTFHVRASYRDETRRLVQQMNAMGLKDLAIVYLDNAYGKEVLGYANEAFKEQNITSIGTFALDVAGKNGEELAKKVVDANPGAVFLITTGTANTSFMRRTPSSKSPSMSLRAAMSRLPSAWPPRPPGRIASGNRYCSRCVMVASESDSAARQFRMSPIGGRPMASRKRPDDPPSSATVTIAVRLLE